MQEAELRAGLISGGKVALANKMSAEHGWDGNSIKVVPVMVSEGGVIVDTHWELLGQVKDLVFSANSLWPKASKDIQVNICIGELSVFDFPGCTNISVQLEEEELDITFSAPNLDDPNEFTPMRWEDARQLGAGNLTFRAIVVPKDHKGATITIGAIPFTNAELVARLGNDNSNSLLTPHIGLHLNERIPTNLATAGRSIYGAFSRQEQVGDGYRIGVIPWIDVTAEGEEDAILPESDDIKEALLRFMRLSTCSVMATTVAAMESRVRAVAAGNATKLKNPADSFLVFRPSMGRGTGEQQPHQGWWFLFTPFKCQLTTEWGLVSSLVREDSQRNDLIWYESCLDSAHDRAILIACNVLKEQVQELDRQTVILLCKIRYYFVYKEVSIYRKQIHITNFHK